jgi:hypothetical protein
MNQQSKWLFEAPLLLEVKNGHEREKWSACKREGARQRSCDITFKVKFRRSFRDFRSEVEQALGRWMTSGRAQILTKKLEEKLKKFHQEIIDLNYPDVAPMHILGKMIYRGANDTWRVVDGSFQAYMLFSKSQIQSGAR